MRHTLFTIGHSTRAGAELVAMLQEAGVQLLADVRRYPGSRRHPQFNRDALAESLAAEGLRYEWLGQELGGRRKQIVHRDASRNGAWKNAGFRNYADAMATPEFQSAVAALAELARAEPTAILCAERDWSRCHRQLLADLFSVQGWRVVHLIEPGRREEHRISPHARVEEGELRYPALL